MYASEIIAILAGLVHILGYLDYNRQVFRGATKPNAATWMIWSGISILSMGTYLSSTGDVWKSIIPLVNILLCFGTLCFAIYFKRFEWPSMSDMMVISLGLVVTVIWSEKDSPQYANLTIQLAFVTGFYTTWRAILNSSACEHPRPWWIWMAGYVLATIVVVMRWKGQWIDLVYPINCIILHASIPLLSSSPKFRARFIRCV